MKKPNKLVKAGLGALVLGTGCFALASCNLEKLFIYGGSTINQDDIETFEGTNNAIFFALYNYYGYEGQHFTNKWLGMNDALADHGVTVTGYEGQKDARKFKISIDKSKTDLPEDTDIYMVNNQNWDSGIQYDKPFKKYHPMAVISTCNGVEFASSPILSSGDAISNATMGGFSDAYREAFVNGSLRYLVAKYSAHILPIFAASVDAVETGKAMKNEDGTALRLSITNWAIQTLDEYDKMSAVDSVSKEHPTVRKLNVDEFFDKNSSSYGAEKLSKWVADSSKENITALYNENGTNEAADKASYRTGRQIKCGIIAPSSVNDTVQKYIDYIKDYLAEAYNVIVLPVGAVNSTNTQSVIAKQLCNQGAEFVISLQDDTERNRAAEICNENKVFFSIGGSCQNLIDYDEIKNLPYYVGSIGTSPEEERRAAKEMTEYYLQCMIKRNEGEDALKQFQIEYKKLDTTTTQQLYYAEFKKEEEE